MIKIITPIIEEIKKRTQENKQLHNLILAEKENQKNRRNNKSNSIFRIIDFIDKIEESIGQKKDEFDLKKFEKEKIAELNEIRKERTYKYLHSKNFFALMCVVVLFIILIITIGIVKENVKKSEVTDIAVTEHISGKIENKEQDKTSAEEKISDEIAVEKELNNEPVENTNNEENTKMHDSYEQQSDTVTDGKLENVTAEIVKTENEEDYMVWVPTNGGNKYHSKPSCSKMKNPKQISLKQAEKNGYSACRKCN